MATSFLTDMLARHAAEIEAEIENRTANIIAELQGIRQLGRDAAPSPVASSEPKKGAKRSPGELAALTSILQRYIAKHPGERIEQIAKGLGRNTKELTLPIKNLLADKSISTRGAKRATSYTAR